AQLFERADATETGAQDHDVLARTIGVHDRCLSRSCPALQSWAYLLLQVESTVIGGDTHTHVPFVLAFYVIPLTPPPNGRRAPGPELDAGVMKDRGDRRGVGARAPPPCRCQLLAKECSGYD